MTFHSKAIVRWRNLTIVTSYVTINDVMDMDSSVFERN